MDAAPQNSRSERPPEPQAEARSEETPAGRPWTLERIVSTAVTTIVVVGIVGTGLYDYFIRDPAPTASTAAPKPPGPAFMPNAPHLPDEENLGFVLVSPASTRSSLGPGAAASAFYISK